jgi:hypothetical protein
MKGLLLEHERKIQEIVKNPNFRLGFFTINMV